MFRLGKRCNTRVSLFARPTKFESEMIGRIPDFPKLPELPTSGEYATIRECGEKLVVLPEGLSFLNTVKVAGLPFLERCFVRESVSVALVEAQRRMPDGFGLVILDGYRTPECQAAMFARAYSDPSLAPGFVADPKSAVAPPHTTGGAVDVTLSWNGTCLSLGTTPGSYRQASNLTALECDTPSLDARLRRLLYWTLGAVGFVGIREEWWHYSIGDQEWAVQLSREHAIYGAVPESP